MRFIGRLFSRWPLQRTLCVVHYVNVNLTRIRWESDENQTRIRQEFGITWLQKAAGEWKRLEAFGKQCSHWKLLKAPKRSEWFKWLQSASWGCFVLAKYSISLLAGTMPDSTSLLSPYPLPCLTSSRDHRQCCWLNSIKPMVLTQLHEHSRSFANKCEPSNLGAQTKPDLTCQTDRSSKTCWSSFARTKNWFKAFRRFSLACVYVRFICTAALIRIILMVWAERGPSLAQHRS